MPQASARTEDLAARQNVDSENISTEDLKRCLVALAARGGAELEAKESGSIGRTGLVEKAFFERGGLERKIPHWGDAILCDGMVYATRALTEDSPAEDAIAWFAPRLKDGPRLSDWFWFWAAQALPAINIYLLTGESAYLDYARTVVDALENRIAHTADGAIMPHPPAVEVWVDVVYFSTPAMARLGRLSGNSAIVERALDQLLLHARYLRDDATGLFWHAAYVDKRSHSPCLWARGNSWYSVATTEVLGEVRMAGLDYRLADKVSHLTNIVTRQLKSVIKLQHRDGLWHTVIARPDSYLEASASAGFALALGRALRMKLSGLDLDAATQAHANALAAICAKITPQGDFTGVAQQTPPGDFDWYQSIPVSTAPFGTGICLMALAEAMANRA